MCVTSSILNYKAPDHSTLFDGVYENKFSKINRYSINMYNSPWYGQIFKVYTNQKSQEHEDHTFRRGPLLRMKSKSPFIGHSKPLVFEKRSKSPEKKYYKFCKAESSWAVKDKVERIIFTVTPNEDEPLNTIRLIMFRDVESGYADVRYKRLRFRWCSIKTKVARKKQENLHLVPLMHSEAALVDSADPLEPNEKLIDCHSFFRRIFSSRSTPVPTNPTRLQQPIALLQRSLQSHFNIWNLFSSVENRFEVDIKELPDQNSPQDSLVILCMAIFLRRHLINHPGLSNVSHYRGGPPLFHKSLHYRMLHRV